MARVGRPGSLDVAPTKVWWTSVDPPIAVTGAGMPQGGMKGRGKLLGGRRKAQESDQLAAPTRTRPFEGRGGGGRGRPPNSPATTVTWRGPDHPPETNASGLGRPFLHGQGKGGVGPQTVRCWYGSSCWWKDWRCPHWHEGQQQPTGKGGKGQTWDTHQAKGGGKDRGTAKVHWDLRFAPAVDCGEPVTPDAICTNSNDQFSLRGISLRGSRSRLVAGQEESTSRTFHRPHVGPHVLERRTPGSESGPKEDTPRRKPGATIRHLGDGGRKGGGRPWEVNGNYWKSLTGNSQWRSLAPGRLDSLSAHRGIHPRQPWGPALAGQGREERALPYPWTKNTAGKAGAAKGKDKPFSWKDHRLWCEKVWEEGPKKEALRRVAQTIMTAQVS